MRTSGISALFLLTLAAFLTAPCPACLAAEAGHGSGDNPLFSGSLNLSAWTLLVFLTLLVVLRRAAWEPILEGLRRREQQIHQAAVEATLAREETARARAEYEARLKEAYAEIPRIMEEGRRAAEAAREKLKAEAVARIQQKRQEARREIDAARDELLQQIRGGAVRLATLISAKAIGRRVSEEEHRALAEAVLAERGAAEER